MKIIFSDPKFREFVLDLNRNDQLFELGRDANGRELRSEFARFGNVYATRTVIIKEQKNQPTDRVTLRDTGEFHDSFRLELTSNDEFLITANTVKDSGDLLETWGEDILGISPENMEFVREMAKEVLIPIIYKKLIAA